MITFKDLNIGDNLYVVNKGAEFGLRIETHKIVNKDYDCGYLELKLDDTNSVYIDELSFDSSRCGFLFTNINDAKTFFLQTYNSVYSELVGKAAKYLKKYNDIVEIMNDISEEREQIETELIIYGNNLES